MQDIHNLVTLVYTSDYNIISTFIYTGCQAALAQEIINSTNSSTTEDAAMNFRATTARLPLEGNFRCA